LLLPESIRFRVHRDPRDRRIGDLLRRIDPTVSLTGREEYILSEQGEGQRPRIAELFQEGRAGLTIFLWAAMFLVGGSLPLLGTWLPTYFTAVGGLSLERGVALTGLFASSGLVALPIAGLLVDRWSSPARAATLLTTIAGIATASMGLVDANSLWLYASLILSGAGICAALSSVTTVATYLYPTRVRGVGVGWAVGISRIGAIVGPAAGGGMLAAHWSLSTIFLTASTGSFVAALTTLGLWSTRRSAETENALSAVPRVGT